MEPNRRSPIDRQSALAGHLGFVLRRATASMASMGMRVGSPPALCAGLLTPHRLRPQVSGGVGDLRSPVRRGRETCAERSATQ